MTEDFPATAAPTIDLRMTWTPILPLLGGFSVMGVTAGGYGVYLASGRLLSIALALAAAIAFLVAMTVRSLTVIAMDGIRDRRPFAPEVFIPWSEVQEVVVTAQPRRTVKVIQRGRRWGRTLSAIRDGDVTPDGLGFDELIAVIRHRAHHRWSG